MTAERGLLAVLGGTFDPIHFGHLRLAQEAAEALGAAEVHIVPAGTPPHRWEPVASPEHRAEMVRRAIAGNPLFRLDLSELERGGKSYSVDTVAALRAQAGAQRPICLLMGADAFLGLETWHCWRELFTLAHLVVAHRPGFDFGSFERNLPPELQGEFEARWIEHAEALAQRPAGCIRLQPITPLDISSTAIRRALKTGRSPRYLLPDVVLDYIRSNSLYL